MKHELIEQDLKPTLELYSIVSKKALQRLQTMGHDKAPELSDPNSRFFKNSEAYALARYSYYTCFKCKKPYFGGERACDAANREAEYNPQELMCGGCASSGKDKCDNHGTDYM